MTDTYDGATDKTEHDDVLPHELPDTDVHAGIGAIHTVVSLAEHTEHLSVQNGRCRFCGYDRAEKVTHTEVDGYTLTCMACERKVGEVF